MAEEKAPENNPQPEKESSYAKKSGMKGLLIYAVIGLLVYGIIYYFAFSKKGGSYSPSSTTNNSQGTSAPVSNQNTGSTAQEAKVSLTNSGFVPQTITVKAGTTVVWTNNSGATATINSAPHPVHTDYPPLNLGQFADGASLSLTFDTPGTYKYHNHLNPSVFGTVVVE